MSAAHDLTETDFTILLRQRDFKQLFNRLGWDNIPKGTPDVLLSVPGPPPVAFTFKPVKEKHGFLVLHCATLPTTEQRRRLSLDMSKRYAEHLLIYAPDANGAEQLWQLVVRDPGQPVRFFEFRVGATQKPRALWQRVEGLAISLDDDEAGLTLTQVREKTRRAFALNAEQVTNKFYQEFSQQHQSFQKLIKGIDSSTDRAWYASIMLNRIMFIYFVQAQGYLLVDAAGPSGNNDKEYLNYKLKQCTKLIGKDKFQSFYQDFLRVLFRDGLNAPLPHTPGLSKLLGRVPYLNGGLFEEHELERTNTKLQIPDAAFEKLFAFLGKWNWILDSRQKATGTTINPDVIGYIFEQYINGLERKAKGSYYTKEDVTEYIAKNCLIPALFEGLPNPAAPFHLLQEQPQDYIYAAARYGLGDDLSVPNALPANIAVGQKDLSARAAWQFNTDDKSHGLPTEIWRETVARQQRALTTYEQLSRGEVTTMPQMVTLNLDIRQFAQDAIRNAEESEWVWLCYERLHKMTVLDPTCGSGAFLFAALNVLVPLYDECLNRMEVFIGELDRNISHDRRRRISDMKTVLEEVSQHRNREHFITKSIVLNNLYGVDLMHEAVEIAKLRLFLQLMSTLPEPVYDDPAGNMGLEPLPDVDFNIRAGNTLVGFVNMTDVRKVAFKQEPMFAEEVIGTIEEKLGVVAELAKEFRRRSETNDHTLPAAKRELKVHLALLNDKLNEYQGILHGKDAAKYPKKFDEWCEECRPFNWFAEFFDIMHRRGGFDVIIGNPPYVGVSGVTYLDNYPGVKCSDLYGYVTDRALSLLHKKGQFGFIVMHSLAFSRGFKEVREKLRNEKSYLWFSFFSRIPAGLFSGEVRVRNCIFILNRAAKKPVFYTTRIHRWFGKKRDVLLHDLEYAPFQFKSVIPMFNNEQETALFENMKGDLVAAKITKISKHKAYFKQSAYNWICVTPAPAPSYLGNKLTPQTKVGELAFLSEASAQIITLLANGRMFFAYWLIYGDEFDVTQDIFKSFAFPFNKLTDNQLNIITKTYKKFVEQLDGTIQFKLNAGKRVGTYNTAKLWHLTDVTDRIFLEHLTDDADAAQQVILDHVSSTLMTGRGLEVEEDE